jgi:hypothetical protein
MKTLTERLKGIADTKDPRARAAALASSRALGLLLALALDDRIKHAFEDGYAPVYRPFSPHGGWGDAHDGPAEGEPATPLPLSVQEMERVHRLFVSGGQQLMPDRRRALLPNFDTIQNKLF